LNDHGTLATCLPLMLESGFSARNFKSHDATIKGFYGTWEVLKLVPQLAEIALDLQSRLFAKGMGRSVGSFDLIRT
jgi:hypothetical protein